MNAVFFDMDGTLFDSRADLASAVNYTRCDLGLKPLPQDVVVGFVGRGARYLLENAIPEVSGKFDELWPQFSANYRAHMLDETELYPGVRDTLDELAARGWIMGINTNKPNFAARDMLEYFGILHHFGNAIIAGGDCTEMKPSGLPIRECAMRMQGHALSQNDWMVGDNWTDMESGLNAGVKTAFCSFGFGHLNDSYYTVKIDSFPELLCCLVTSPFKS
ncbi:MAG: HAD hydrolase-like protein [Kiritimatiellae bacterium]|nr:HAD hydrolase-like protein [Kiritimatiellia bacterium]